VGCGVHGALFRYATLCYASRCGNYFPTRCGVSSCGACGARGAVFRDARGARGVCGAVFRDTRIKWVSQLTVQLTELGATGP